MNLAQMLRSKADEYENNHNATTGPSLVTLLRDAADKLNNKSGMTYYVIRHKASGEFMPQCKKRGYTHWNPTTGKSPDSALGVPRLIDTRKKAHRCIVQWAALPNAHNSFDYEGEVDLETKSDGRKKEDLEVVEIEIIVRDKGCEHDWKSERIAYNFLVCSKCSAWMNDEGSIFFPKKRE